MATTNKENFAYLLTKGHCMLQGLLAKILLFLHSCKIHNLCEAFYKCLLISFSVWSEEQMICIWFSWCHCYPIISCFIKIQNGLPFWCQLTQVVLERRPL